MKLFKQKRNSTADVTTRSASKESVPVLSVPSGPSALVPAFLVQTKHKGRLRGTHLLDATGARLEENKLIIHAVTQKELTTFIADAPVPEAQKKEGLQHLLSECFITQVQGASTGHFRVIGTDIKSFSRSDACNTFFLQIALASDFRLLRSMAEAAFVAEDETFFVALLHLLPEEKLFDFLDIYLQRGIKECSSVTEVLRTDWVETALLKAWTSKNWKALQNHEGFSDCIRNVTRVPWAFQLNPLSMSFPSMLKGNEMTVRHVVGDLLGILGDLCQPTRVPSFFQRVCKRVRELVEAKFPGTDSSPAVSTLVVLRGMTPAILNPHSFGLVDSKPDEHARASLRSVARVVQQAANKQPFPASSEFACLNAVLEEMGQALNDSIAKLGIDGDLTSFGLSSDVPPLLRHACVSISKRLKWHNEVLRQRLKLTMEDANDPRLDIANQRFDAVVGRLLYRFGPLDAKAARKKSSGASSQRDTLSIPSMPSSMTRSDSMYSINTSDDDDFFDSSVDDNLALAMALAYKLVEETRSTPAHKTAEKLYEMLSAIPAAPSSSRPTTPPAEFGSKKKKMMKISAGSNSHSSGR